MSVVQIEAARRSTHGERIATLEEWKNQHEQRCEERQTTILSRLNRIEVAAWSVAIGLLAWAGSQLWQVVAGG